MTRSEWMLTFVLRWVGTVASLAFIAVIMPRAWMAACHEWLGLGPFPDGPIVEYLARTLSMFYAFLGLLFWLASRDVRRHADMISVFGGLLLVFGVSVLVIDIVLVMPRFWIAGEGPMTVLIGSLFLVLAGRVRAETDVEELL